MYLKYERIFQSRDIDCRMQMKNNNNNNNNKKKRYCGGVQLAHSIDDSAPFNQFAIAHRLPQLVRKLFTRLKNVTDRRRVKIIVYLLKFGVLGLSFTDQSDTHNKTNKQGNIVVAEKT